MKTIRAITAIAGCVVLSSGTSWAGFQAPEWVNANPDGTFQYSWRYVCEQPVSFVMYLWYGAQNVTQASLYNCPCEEDYCAMLPGEVLEVVVNGSLTDIHQPGLVENTFMTCSGDNLWSYTHIISPTVDVGDEIAAALELRATPNPCRDGTQLHYSLPAAGRVRITVHDVSGRRVGTVVDATESAGDHMVSWKPRGDRGRLPPAVYFAVLEFGGQSKMQRILVLQ